MIEWVMERLLGSDERRREFDTEVSKLTESLWRVHGTEGIEIAQVKARRKESTPSRRKVYGAVAKALAERAKREARRLS